MANDWLFLDFVRAYNAEAPEAMVIDQPVFGLIATMNPPFLLIWLPGLVYGLIAKDPRDPADRHRGGDLPRHLSAGRGEVLLRHTAVHPVQRLRRPALGALARQNGPACAVRVSWPAWRSPGSDLHPDRSTRAAARAPAAGGRFHPRWRAGRARNGTGAHGPLLSRTSRRCTAGRSSSAAVTRHYEAIPEPEREQRDPDGRLLRPGGRAEPAGWRDGCPWRTPAT